MKLPVPNFLPQFVGALVAAIALITCASHASAATAPSKFLPESLNAAQELAALPNGEWLALDKRGLTLFDAQGKSRAKLPVRGKHLDVRSDGKHVIAALLDSDIQHAVSIEIDLASGQFSSATPLPQQNFSVETLCLFRDQQALTQLFIVGKDGQAEHWLLQAQQSARLIRKLALPVEVEHCKVDDARHSLYVAEPGVGIWAYEANSESAPARQLLALSTPRGKLSAGVGPLAVLGEGIAVLDEKKQRWQMLSKTAKQWQISASHSTPAQQLVSDGQHLYAQHPSSKRWQMQANAVSRTAEVVFPVIAPLVQTDVMPRLGDAADDPAIWVHPQDPSLSRVLGTNKKQGLLVYDMQGRQVQSLEVGRVNNVDVRQNVILDGGTADLALASQRDDNSLVLFNIGQDGTVSEAARFATTLDKIYGLCLGQPSSGGLQVYVNDKDGRYQQYALSRQAGIYRAALVRQFKLASQPEGCVVDDVAQRLFVGEEKRGVYVLSAAADAPVTMQMVLAVGQQMRADVEGMAVYYAKDGKRYVLVSSQGDNSYVLFNAQPPYQVMGRFRIGFNLAKNLDGASETDGLDISSKNLGPGFEQGMLVVQDGYKRLPDGPQNFKYLSWQEIAKALRLP